MAGTLPSRRKGGGFPGTDGACAGHVTAFNWQSGGDVRQNPQEGRTDALHKSQTPAVYPTLRENRRSNSNPATEARMLVQRHWWDGSDRADTLTENSRNQRMPDKGNLEAVLSYDYRKNSPYIRREQANTLAETDHKAPQMLHGASAVPRRLTPRECERLQGFPDDWTASGIDADGEPVEISDTQRYRQMGNAVSVPVAAWIGSRIVAAEMGAVDEC